MIKLRSLIREKFHRTSFNEIYNDPTRWAYRNKMWGPSLSKATKSLKFKEYTLLFEPNRYEDFSVIYAVDSNKVIVGELFFGKPHPTSKNIEGAIEIHPDHRRKGLASEMYRWAEELSGMVIQPSRPHSAAAAKFWDQPNIKFGPMKGVQEVMSPYSKATNSDVKRGYIGSVSNQVVGYNEMVPDVMQVDHSELPSGRMGARFRWFAANPANTVMWNEFPPTESDKHKVEDWLSKKGVKNPRHISYREYIYHTTGKWE